MAFQNYISHISIQTQKCMLHLKLILKIKHCRYSGSTYVQSLHDMLILCANMLDKSTLTFCSIDLNVFHAVKRFHSTQFQNSQFSSIRCGTESLIHTILTDKTLPTSPFFAVSRLAGDAIHKTERVWHRTNFLNG